MFRKAPLFSAIAILLFSAAGCSNAQTSSEASNVRTSFSFPNPIEEEKLSKIIDTFYQKSFIEKGVTDDSSFCGYYEPRTITKESFLPLDKYGEYGDTLILSFAINGFWARTDSFSYIVIEDGKLTFPHLELYSYGCPTSKYLLPQVYRNGEIWDIEEAFDLGIVGTEVFHERRGPDGKQYFSFSAIGWSYHSFNLNVEKEYFESLPRLVNLNSNYSYLLPRFEEIKSEITEKYKKLGFEDDSRIREALKGNLKQAPAKPFGEHSIHLDEYYPINDRVTLYAYSMNDIRYDYGLHYDIIGHDIRIGGLILGNSYVIDPALSIDGQIYLLSEANEAGLIDETIESSFRNAFPYGSVQFEAPYSNRLEFKIDERNAYYAS